MGCQLLKDSFNRAKSNFKVVGCATSQQDILRLLTPHACDVALIGGSLGDGPLTGFHAVRELRHSFPKTRAVMLIKATNQDLVVDAFRAGAKGVYLRTESVKTLTKCITAVHNGQIWANNTQLSSVLDAFVDVAPIRNGKSNGHASLTKREGEVVKLVVEGLSNREVAESLGLAEHTVSNYLFRIYSKLGISSRVELVLYSLQPPRSIT